MQAVLFVLLGILLLIVFSGGYMFVVACRRGKEIDWLDRDILEKTPYADMYDDIAGADKWIREHNARDVWITSHDGLRLHGLWIEAENPKGTVLLAHGYRSCYLLDFSLVLDVYHRLGFHLLIPDQRAHRKSQGKYITFGVKESRDLLGWLRFHNEQFGHLPVLLSGMSMGASTVLYTADEELPANVRGIIADCGYTAPYEILKHVFRRIVHFPAGPIIWVTDLFARIFAGFSIYAKDTRKTLGNCRVPVLMVHGMEDKFVPCDMTRQGYDACASEKQLLTVSGAGHGVSYFHDQVGYSAAVMYFIKTHIVDLEI